MSTQPPRPQVSVRPATKDDALVAWQWRNDAGTRRASLQSEPVSWPDHLLWFSQVLGDPHRVLLVAESGGERVAIVRLDEVEDGVWEVSVNVSPHARGRGYGLAVVTAAIGRFADEPKVHLLARVRQDNDRSRRLFQELGFREESRQGEVIHYRLSPESQ